jgi:streptomycin 6-kinase
MIPAEFAKKMVKMYGISGEQWVKNLPSWLHKLQQKHNFSYGEPFSLSYNFVIRVYWSDGRTAVLKTGYPGHDLTHEFQALQDFQGEKFVKIIDSNNQEGWVLLEHLQPGTSLRSLDDEQRVLKIFADVAYSLWRKAPTSHSYPTVKKWSEGISRLLNNFDGGTGPLPASLVERAETLYSHLIRTSQTQYLLHGDLHHGNILYSEKKGWTSIDPKGLIGEKEYDCLQFLLNEWTQHPDPLALLHYRVQSLSFLLSVSYERMLSWGFCHCILSSCWCIEDSVDDWKGNIKLAYLFLELMENP